MGAPQFFFGGFSILNHPANGVPLFQEPPCRDVCRRWNTSSMSVNYPLEIYIYIYYILYIHIISYIYIYIHIIYIYMYMCVCVIRTETPLCCSVWMSIGQGSELLRLWFCTQSLCSQRRRCSWLHHLEQWAHSGFVPRSFLKVHDMFSSLLQIFHNLL